SHDRKASQHRAGEYSQSAAATPQSSGTCARALRLPPPANTCPPELETDFALQRNDREQTPCAHARTRAALPTHLASVVSAAVVASSLKVEQLEPQLASASF